MKEPLPGGRSRFDLHFKCAAGVALNHRVCLLMISFFFPFFQTAGSGRFCLAVAGTKRRCAPLSEPEQRLSPQRRNPMLRGALRAQ